MKIGYPCLNLSLNSGAKTFRLATYSEAKFKEVVENNIEYLNQLLQFNIEKGILFLRISSGMIPFASHPVCKVDWADFYKKEFLKIGKIIKQNNMRISMHPDQFVLINTLREQVLENSIAELIYHAKFLDALGLDVSHKIQIHVGGVYDDKQASIARFIERYKKLSLKIRRRLVIENDDHLYSLADCLYIYKKIKIPVLLDVFHHKCYNQGENMALSLKKASATWTKINGVPMLDYSSQKPHGRKGAHVESLNIRDFNDFVKNLGRKDFDIMLEIKDKEKSALRVIEILKKLKKI